MIKALIRFILFEIPAAICCGLTYIILDKKEIVNTEFYTKDQNNKQIEQRRILLEYLESCHKQVYKRGK